MHTTKLLSMLGGLIVLGMLLTFSVAAEPPRQDGYLLQDPAFDLAAQSIWRWEQWSYQVEVIKSDAKKEPDLERSFYVPSFLPSESKWDHGSSGQSGAAGAISGRTFTKFRAGLYQTVQIVKGTRVHFSIWANEFCESGVGRCSVILKAGIDPTGGKDWSSTNIKWAIREISDNKYVQLVTEDVIVGESGSVTVFTWGEPPDLPSNSAAFFDDATLGLTSSVSPQTTPGASPQAPGAGQPTAAALPAACAQLRWVSDVTIPDGTAMAPGVQFTKTWRVQNTGSCAFLGTLNFVGKGNQMGGQSPMALSKTEAGQQADVSINLIAPTQAGDYYGTWQPRTTDGTPMENLVVRIKVSAQAVTPFPVVTATPRGLVLLVPTAPPTPATSQICVQAYNDFNGDGQQDTDETLMAGVTFTLLDATGSIDSYTTDGTTEPYCFMDLPLGNYQLTSKPPANYASTTPNAIAISLSADPNPNVTYGATRTSSSSNAGATTGGALGSTFRPILIVISVVVLIALVGVGGMLLVVRRR
jgi:Ig-like domain from next to BRCA1 gene/SdrD B-like domain